MGDEWKALAMFYGMGMMACAWVMVPRCWRRPDMMVACLILLVIWPVIAGDVIDIDRERHGYYP